MKLLILLCAIVHIRATSVPENCNGVRIINSPVLHEREVLKTDLNYPIMLTIDYSTNTLYFGHETEDTHAYITTKVDLNNKKFKDITGVPNGHATAFDSQSNEVYIGGTNGIYKYDPKTDIVEPYVAAGKFIWSVYFHDYLYYTVFPAEFLHVVKNGEDVTATDLEGTKVDYFVVDKDNDIFYSNTTGVYGRKKGANDAELYKQLDETNSKYLTTDKNGIVHICLYDGLYVVNKDTKRFDKILEIENLNSVAFDMENNIIYSDAHNIYILKPNKNLSC